jgi:hypothetical protein
MGRGGDRAAGKRCYACGKEPLGRDEVGLVKKLLDGEAKRFFCLGCLADYLEVEADFLLAKAQEFKEQGCESF